MKIPPFVDVWSLNRKKRFYLFEQQKLVFDSDGVKSLRPDQRCSGSYLNFNFDSSKCLSIESSIPMAINIAGSRRTRLDVRSPLFFGFEGHEVFIDNIEYDAEFWFSGYLSKAIKGSLGLSRQASTVFIIGDTGTGKELLARNLHYNSQRRHGPFVAVNCASLCAHTAERELFGNVKGAFTSGAVPSKGLFMNASSGTLFLDNIEDLPMNVQPMLLRALELHEVKAAGSDISKKHKARVMVSSSLSPKDLLYGGLIRKDLYYRIEEFCIYLPELNQMKDEFGALMGFYAANEYSLESGLLDHLLSYGWPGNLRELRNAVERAKMITSDKVLRVSHFDLEAKRHLAPLRIKNPYLIYPFENEERDFIFNTLERNDWNIVDTARELNLCRSTLSAKIDYYGLEVQN